MLHNIWKFLIVDKTIYLEMSWKTLLFQRAYLIEKLLERTLLKLFVA